MARLPRFFYCAKISLVINYRQTICGSSRRKEEMHHV